MFSRSFAGASFFASFALQSSGHALIAAVQGANGVTGAGFGTDASIPRDGGNEQPFQIDTTVFKDLTTNPCGETLMSGSNDIQNQLAAALEAGNGELPSIPADGTLTLTMHLVNADGGGPFSAAISTDATGAQWTDIDVVTNTPGNQGLVTGGASDADLTVSVPAGTTCTGGTNGNACLIRVTNGGEENSFANGPGPFGGCVAVQQDGAGAATANGNATAATTTNNSNGDKTGSSDNAKSNKAKNNRRVRRTPEERVKWLHAIRRDDLRRETLIARLVDLQKSLSGHVKRENIGQLDLADIEDIITATGASIDNPVDFFFGINSADPNGGRAAIQLKDGATIQQAEDLKQAVRQAISNAITVLADPSTAGTSTLGAKVLLAAESSANGALADGSLESTSSAPTGIPSGDSIAKLINPNENIDGVVAIASLKTAAPAVATGNTGNTANNANNGNNNQNAQTAKTNTKKNKSKNNKRMISIARAHRKREVHVPRATGV